MGKRLLGVSVALIMLCSLIVPIFASGTVPQQPAEQTENGVSVSAAAEDAAAESSPSEEPDGAPAQETAGEGSPAAEAEAADEAITDAAAAAEVPAEEESTVEGEPLQEPQPTRTAAVMAAAAGVGTVTDGISANENIEVHLFNYDRNIRSNSAGYVLGFHNNNKSWPAKDGEGCGSPNTFLGAPYDHRYMQSTLGADGYPQYGRGSDIRSLKYLFDTSLPSGQAGQGYNSAVTHYKASKNSGLFRNVGNGYLEYDCAVNAAYFDTGNGRNRFVLYDGVVRPGHAAAEGSQNFLPFNLGSQFLDDGEAGHYKLAEGDVDLWFGMSVSFDFLMPRDGKVNGQDMVFEFMGDDDVWVFIDDVLVLDIGGTHAAQKGTINFATGECDSPQLENTTLQELLGLSGSTFTDYTKHTFRFFYLERGGNISYCKLKFNLQTLPQKSLTIGKELTTDSADVSLNEYLQQTYDYQFRVLNAEDRSLYIGSGTPYQLYSELNGSPVGTGTTDENGYITLKAGQYAQFSNMMQYSDNGSRLRYIVEETMPNGLTDQYGDVSYTVGSGGGSQKTGQNRETSFTGYNTDPLSADETQVVVYNNRVTTQKLGCLSVTKRVEGSGAPDGAVFPIQVKLGGRPLPVGFAYTVDGAEKTVTAEGVIPLRAGQTADISGIIAGTVFQVTEEADASGRMEEDDNGYFTLQENGIVVAEAAGSNGIVDVGEAVSVTVTNCYIRKTADVAVQKLVTGQLGDKTRAFFFTYRYTDAEQQAHIGRFSLKDGGTFIIERVPVGSVVTVTEDACPGYTTTAAVNGGSPQAGSTAAVTAGAADSGSLILFTNEKEAQVDTGILLDTLPYVLALAMAAGGGTLLCLRRGKSRE